MEQVRRGAVELSIVMPCLNEESTVGSCVRDAMCFLKENDINGEILVVDNGSKDASADMARQQGAIVITEPLVGYGNALRTGFTNAAGKIIIMGDCDTTYDFSNLREMYDLLDSGTCDLVVGNRYTGGIEKGAMSIVHKLGVRFLSFCGRKRYDVDIYDFHCGLRGLTKGAYEQMQLECEGMELATEMIAKAAKNELRIRELPVPLRKCRIERKSKLRTIRDGMRHILYMMRCV